MMKALKIFVGIILCLFFVAWVGIRIYKDISFSINAGGHLKRAADANTVELATKELNTTINYLESNGITKGYTSILYRTPNEDIEYWYTNLKFASMELSKVNNTTTQLEKSNILMKLRETLLDGQCLTIPPGISVFPNNVFYCWFGYMSFIMLCIGAGLIWSGVTDY